MRRVYNVYWFLYCYTPVMIQVNRISKAFGGQSLFQDISFLVGERERIGLVGRNGSGKSTIFRLVLGELYPDEGEIQIPKNYKIGSLAQHLSFSKPTVLDECAQFLGADEQYDTYKVEKILFGLGFTLEDMQKAPESFSGGYQIRINLAQVLVQQPNLLLLDEPTNYLDILSLRWLKRFLQNFPGEVVLITHDRDFMDSVSTHIMGLHRQMLRKIRGDTKKFYQQISLDEEIYEQTRMNQEKKRKELQDFVDRFRAKASKATQAQSRLKQLEKMGSLDKLASEKNLDFRFRHSECPGKNLMQVDGVSFSYDGTKENLLFQDLSFPIGREDRIAIIGKNGKGKSTLLNVLGETLKPVEGKLSHHPSLKRGHFGQTNIQRLNLNSTVIEEISHSNSALTKTEVRNICGTVMFEGDSAEKKISVLSGGERSRVLLGKILAHPTNLLLLDEPTNHLDVESVEALCEEIAAYPGAVVLVTHSELLLRRLVNRLIIFHEGGAEYFLGGYDDFLEKVGWEEEAGTNVKPKKKKLTKKEYKQRRADIITERSRKIGPLKKQIEKLEEGISSYETQLKQNNQYLVEASESGLGDKISSLSGKIREIEVMIESMFNELETASLEHDKLMEEFDSQLAELAF
jgi:ATP-binding cassette subfamily F protein 3